MGEQSVPCQQRHRFSVLDVAGGLPPPQVIVIHAGQIIVNQRIGVNHLQCGGRRQSVMKISPQAS